MYGGPYHQWLLLITLAEAFITSYMHGFVQDLPSPEILWSSHAPALVTCLLKLEMVSSFSVYLTTSPPVRSPLLLEIASSSSQLLLGHGLIIPWPTLKSKDSLLFLDLLQSF